MRAAADPRAHRARPTVRVVIAHRQRAFAEALRIALEKTPGFRATAVVHDVPALLEVARKRQPDVVVVDEAIAGADGGAGWEVKQVAAPARVLVLSPEENERLVARAVEGGADAVLAQTRPLRDVVQALQALSRGQTLIDPDVLRRAQLRLRRRREESAALAERLNRLTSREVEILQHMADGLSSDEIAAELGISPHTLRTHVQNVLMKLRVHSKLQAVTAAIRHGVVRVRTEPTVDVERRVVDLTSSESRGAAYGGGTTGSTSAGRSGRGRSRGS